jgi:hypothetical protein
MILFAASAWMLSPLVAHADSPLDGTWKADPSTAELPSKPDVLLLKDGMFRCDSCVPPVVIKADGQDQRVTGHPYFDTKSVKAIDDRTIQEIDKKAGKVVDSKRWVVSPDGKTASCDETDSTAPNGPPVLVKSTYERVLRGAPGGHVISGSWRITKLNNVSEAGLLVTYKLDGTVLKMTNPLGQSYAATLDGGDAPFVGDPGITSVVVKSINKSTIEESDKRDGKIIWIGRIAVSADGKSMSVMWIDNLHGTTGAYGAKKQ